MISVFEKPKVDGVWQLIAKPKFNYEVYFIPNLFIDVSLFLSSLLKINYYLLKVGS